MNHQPSLSFGGQEKLTVAGILLPLSVEGILTISLTPTYLINVQFDSCSSRGEFWSIEDVVIEFIRPELLIQVSSENEDDEEDEAIVFRIPGAADFEALFSKHRSFERLQQTFDELVLQIKSAYTEGICESLHDGKYVEEDLNALLSSGQCDLLLEEGKSSFLKGLHCNRATED